VAKGGSMIPNVVRFPLILAALTSAGFSQSRPQISIGVASLGLQMGVTGDSATSYRIEGSYDLRSWLPIALTYPSRGTYPANTNFQFIDREFGFGGQKFYRAAPASSTGPSATNAPDIIVSDSLVTLYEGDSTTFTAQLARMPAGPMNVLVQRSAGSTNISVANGASLSFGPANWSTPQAVTVVAGGHLDFQDSLAALTLSASNLISAQVKVQAVDNAVDDEFVGPFDSWRDVKRDFGAKGNGLSDDTMAIQTALNTLQPNSTNHVLYLPAGIYRITQPLDFPSHGQVIMIVGENPSNTIIRWDGATNGVMLTYGAWYSKMTRLTFDGAGKAKTGIAHDSPFSTHNEFSDMVFKDLQFGIEAGTPTGGGNAETAVERCQFVWCTLAGISIQNPNSLDWFIWNSEFDDCGQGVSNTYGAGNFHVYESLFRRSTQADIGIANTGYFSARNNTSVGSAAFFTAGPVASCGLITLQGNTVVSPQGVPLQLADYGPYLLLDNWIQDFQGLAGNIEPSAGFFSLGNTFTVSNAIPSGFDGPAGIRLDNVVIQQKIPVLLPKIPGPLLNLHRQVFDLPGPTNAPGIQAAINQAAAAGGSRPVVHLPAGNYSIQQTLTIPAGSDLQLIGDGGATSLTWTGTGQGPILYLPGPARATLRDFYLFGTGTNPPVDGILIDKCDQVRGRIFGDQLDLYRSTQVGLSVEGLTNTSVSLENLYHEGNPTSIRVVGASTSPDYNSAMGQVSVFGGASAGNGITYDVRNGGKLLVRDMWYETSGSATNLSPRFMLCTNSGWFTLHGAQVALSQTQSGVPVVEVSNFVGRLSFLTTQFNFTNTNSTFSVDGHQTNTAVLLLNTLNGVEPAFNSVEPQTSLLQSFETLDGPIFNPLTDAGPTDPVFLKQMLDQTRSSRPPLLAPLPSGLTDARVHRVIVENTRVGLRLTP
jgi:hypothetical protein